MAPFAEESEGSCRSSPQAMRAAGRRNQCSGSSTPILQHGSADIPVSTPQRKGALARGYESRFGSAIFDAQSPLSSAQQSPRIARKLGVQNFTDPTNPSGRNLSKAMANIEEARADVRRAGARTRNPCMIPVGQQNGTTPEHQKIVPYRYGHHDWKPAKRCPDVACAPSSHVHAAGSPRASDGAAGVLSMPRADAGYVRPVLENYLNDMKRCSKALRSVANSPSMNQQRANVETSSILPSDTKSESDTYRRSRSLSLDRSVNEQSSSTDPYGFARKRSVSRDWTRSSSRDFLYHTTKEPQVATPRPSPRQEKADRRFEEVVSHMKNFQPEARKQFDAFKSRSYNSTGLLDNHAPVIA
eukprot:TRINITY_DN89962_c0_g1_i1.p1 TRINITY_DN89962_c0_g1~~TRINITY_DN89962_c0_g1_i1.p1  ORF type:complete len:357 (-),score=49.40 TRINITY_DN89962_c0_g1_i1:79-1149(-)